jgi:hypothetical protein
MELLILVIILALGFCLFKAYGENKRLNKSLIRYQELASQEDYQRNLAEDISSKQREIFRLDGEYKRIASKYSGLCSQDELEECLRSDIKLKKEELSRLDKTAEELLSRINSLQKNVNELEEEDYIQSFGFYQPKYDFISAGSYTDQLKQVKAKQRKMVKGNEAVICDTSWTIQGSEKEGQKMVQNFQRLLLTIFNAECDSFVSKLKYNSNVEAVEAKMSKVFDKLNKSAKVIHCEINKKYLGLKFQELSLQYQVECEIQEEREREKAIREEAKERRKLEGYMKAAEEAEEREYRFRQELEIALKEQELSYGVEKEKLEIQIHGLRQKLEKAMTDKDNANEQVALEKAGNLYVISNIGSFGRDNYRICMTKKSGDPDDYVGNMGASTPFPFDIHLKFISENALETLSQLHQVFSDRRVNKARSERKGFFQVSLDEIIAEVERIKRDTGNIKSIQLISKTPQAYDYRRTLAIERKAQDGQNTKIIKLDDEIA